MGTGLLVKTRVPPLSALNDIRAQIAKVDPDQQIAESFDLNSFITRDSKYAQQRLVATLFGIFSFLALALAVVGLYSVVFTPSPHALTNSASAWPSAQKPPTSSGSSSPSSHW
jgi:hypothetical protein